MKKLLIILLAACLTAIPVLTAYAQEDFQQDPYKTGMNRADTLYRKGMTGNDFTLFNTAGLCETYGISETNGLALYQPQSGQPLNICAAVNPECYAGVLEDESYLIYNINDGFDPEAVKSLSITAYGDHRTDYFFGRVVEICDRICEDSGEALQFVNNPDDADILLSVSVTYPYYDIFYDDAGNATDGHSCRIDLTAVQLSQPSNYANFSMTRDPENQVTNPSLPRFVMSYPTVTAQDLEAFTNEIMGWYGTGTSYGSLGTGVAYMQRALIDRGFLEGDADGSFGPMTQASVMHLQEYYGMEQTGIADPATLMNLYYGQAVSHESYSAPVTSQEDQASVIIQEDPVPVIIQEDHARMTWIDELIADESLIPDILNALGNPVYDDTLQNISDEGEINRESSGKAVLGLQQTLEDIGCTIDQNGYAEGALFSELNRVFSDYGTGEITAVNASTYKMLLLEVFASEIEEDRWNMVLSRILSQEEQGLLEYLRACSLFRQEKYYSAKTAFKKSKYADFEERAAACVQNFPQNGQIWQNENYYDPESALSFQIDNQINSFAVYLEIWTEDGDPVSGLFLKDSGKVKTNVVPGTYIIKISAGKEWYGQKEAFGKGGNYAYLHFDGKHEWENGHRVTLSEGETMTVYTTVEPGSLGGTLTNWNTWISSLPDR